MGGSRRPRAKRKTDRRERREGEENEGEEEEEEERMIVIDNVPLVVNAKEGDKKQEQLEVVFAATNSPFIQRANSCYVNSHLSLSRSLSRTKKCIHVLQNETASVEFRVDD